MTAAALLLAVLLAAWMGWRGYRRGALGTVMGWVPFVAAGVVLVLGLWVAWLIVTFFVLLCTVALLSAIATLIICFWAVRSAKRHAAASPPERPGGARFRAVLRSLNRFGGAALGLVAASLLVLLIACLTSTLPFAYTLSSAPDGPSASAGAPRWVDDLSRACCTVADVASFGMLDHLPKLGAYAREVRALVAILNAPRDKLRRLADRRGLTALAELPEVKAALADEAYILLLARVAERDLTALRPLAESAATRRILACPQVQAVAAHLRPSELARDLSSPDSPLPTTAGSGAATVARSP